MDDNDDIEREDDHPDGEIKHAQHESFNLRDSSVGLSEPTHGMTLSEQV